MKAILADMNTTELVVKIRPEVMVQRSWFRGHGSEVMVQRPWVQIP